MKAPLLLFVLALANSAAAQDLRIETRVYAEDPTHPVCETVTLFQQGAVYDYRQDRPTVTIYRDGPAGKPGRFVLLDTDRQVRTELTTDKLDQAMTSLRRWAAQSKDPFLKFASAPAFTESFNKETGELQLLGDVMSYRVVTVPMEQPSANLAVRRFLDNFTKLQTLLETRLPPDPRLRVNEALFRHEALPVETRLYSRDQEEPSLRAEHIAVWLLSKNDRSKIDQTIDQMASFREVTNAEYRQGMTVAAK
ncbi:MAG: hypothetical protein KDA37_06160 [Planctomycetales bacterium]|nr:hypothetical protein [Planctomycetales bacterium]